MYVITARLTPTGAGLPLEIERLRTSLNAWRGPVRLGHAYVRGDADGVSLVLFLNGADLPQAESGARALLSDTLAGDAGMAGWTVSHCGADLISYAMNSLIMKDAGQEGTV
ncbi:hypothetical protein OIE66_40320 [Nonomuraea sp. NBC_01738]|uniref:hypothetical protein n=1 Tax=Nonomuraea sp. NBC_01738 TaxID=2976003 RepID=UPI002E0EFB2E|nr:hypothetical protein OIE66_40320 [Nonomuraea sp. NBC_01738]